MIDRFNQKLTYTDNEINTFKDLITFFKGMLFFGRKGRNKMIFTIDQINCSTESGIVTDYVITVKRISKNKPT